MKLVPEPYQLTGQQFLLDHPRAGLFASMGLGKTVMVLLALQQLFADCEIKGALIIAPRRVARLTWPNEILKWFPWMKFEVLKGQQPSGNSHIYLINYERIDELKNLDFCDVVVFDELTRAKNHQSKRIEHLRPMLKHHRRWGLTGTPRPNSLLELFGQIRLLDDGRRLSPSWTQYKTNFFAPEDYMEYNWLPKPGAEEEIYKKISDLVLVMRGCDYTDMPDMVAEDIEVRLPEVAHALYKKLERDLLIAVGNGVVVAPNAGALAMKLHQLCGGAVYDDQKAVIQIHETKISALKRWTKDHPDENAIIACNYIHERDRICAAIPGAVDESQFQGDIEKEWNSGRIKFLVAHPKSLGHGLNLQEGGRSIIWYSPTWSRELYDQLNARVARKGQKQQTYLYRLVTAGTIDEAIVETLRLRGEGQGEMLAMLTNWKRLGCIFK